MENPREQANPIRTSKTGRPSMPLPPPPANELVLYAHVIRGMIRRGMTGGAAADMMVLRYGLAYAREGLQHEPAEVLAQFRADPKARAVMETIEPQFAEFWRQVQTRFQELVAAEGHPFRVAGGAREMPRE